MKCCRSPAAPHHPCPTFPSSPAAPPHVPFLAPRPTPRPCPTPRRPVRALPHPRLTDGLDEGDDGDLHVRAERPVLLAQRKDLVQVVAHMLTHNRDKDPELVEVVVDQRRHARPHHVQVRAHDLSRRGSQHRRTRLAQCGAPDDVSAHAPARARRACGRKGTHLSPIVLKMNMTACRPRHRKKDAATGKKDAANGKRTPPPGKRTPPETTGR